MAWNYRNADPDWAQIQAKFLTEELTDRLESPSIRVLRRMEQVEVTWRRSNKGAAVKQVLSVIRDADFVLAVGNDTNDEEMFLTLHSLLAHAPATRSRSIGAVAGTTMAGGDSAGAGGDSAGAGGDSAGLTNVFTTTVGRRPTSARFFLNDVSDVEVLLNRLVEVDAYQNKATSPPGP